MSNHDNESQTTDYTPEELAEFDSITLEMSSHDQVARIGGRLRLRKFIEIHGKAKCDAMWEAINGK